MYPFSNSLFHLDSLAFKTVKGLPSTNFKLLSEEEGDTKTTMDLLVCPALNTPQPAEHKFKEAELERMALLQL